MRHKKYKIKNIYREVRVNKKIIIKSQEMKS